MHLIDTDILIYGMRGDPSVLSHMDAAGEEAKAISVISYGELLYGAMKSQRPERNLARARHIGEIFPVIDVSRAIVETFGSIKAELRRKGTPLADFDIVIAATAMTLGYCLVTNNERHFKRIDGLRIENWAK